MREFTFLFPFGRPRLLVQKITLASWGQYLGACWCWAPLSLPSGASFWNMQRKEGEASGYLTNCLCKLAWTSPWPCDHLSLSLLLVRSSSRNMTHSLVWDILVYPIRVWLTKPCGQGPLLAPILSPPCSPLTTKITDLMIDFLYPENSRKHFFFSFVFKIIYIYIYTCVYISLMNDEGISKHTHIKPKHFKMAQKLHGVTKWWWWPENVCDVLAGHSAYTWFLGWH